MKFTNQLIKYLLLVILFINFLNLNGQDTEINFDYIPEYISEDGDHFDATAQVCLSIDNPSNVNDTQAEVEVVSLNSTATEGTDFQSLGTVNLTFLSGSSDNQCFAVTALPDSDNEGFENIEFEITSVTGGTNAGIGVVNIGGITIVDSDVTLAFFDFAPSSEVSESSSSGSQTTMLCVEIMNPDPAVPTSVTVQTVGGDAQDNGVDVVEDLSSIIYNFPVGGSVNQCITVTAVDDVISEGYEGFSLDITSITGGPNASILPYNDSYYLGIRDDDNTSVTFNSSNPIDFDENGGQASICFEITNPSPTNSTQADIVINQFSEAELDIDFETDQIGNTFSLTFPAGSSADQCVTFTGLDDTLIEGNETLDIYLYGVSGGDNATVGITEDVTISIIDDDVPSTEVQFASYFEPGVDENGGAFNVCLEIVNPSNTASTMATVEINTINSTATDAIDVQAIGTVNLTFPAGSYSQECFTVIGIDDSVSEGNEILSFDITSATGGNSTIIGSNSTLDLTVEDNDNTQVGLLYPGDLYEDALEGPITANICAYIINPDPLNDTDVVIDLDMNSSATNGVDIVETVPNSQTLTFPAGSSIPQCFSINVVDDNAVEGYEQFVFSISNVSGGDNSTIIQNENISVVSIADDDVTVVQFKSNNPSSFDENAGSAQVCLEISNPSIVNPTNVDVELYFYGSAELDIDFSLDQPTNPFTLTFPAGSSNDVCFTLIGIDDSELEGNEYFDFGINNVNGGDLSRVGSNNYGQLLVVDDEVLPTEVVFSPYFEPMLHENGGSIDVCLDILNESLINDTYATVEVNASNSTADDGVDVQSIGVVNVTFPFGTNGQQCFTVTGIDDFDSEGIENLELNITSASGGESATVGQANVFDLQINDDDNTRVGLNFAIPIYEDFNDGPTSTTVCAYIINPDLTNDTYVDIQLESYSTATNGVDIIETLPAVQTLTFLAGSSLDQCFNVTIVDDSDVEGYEDFTFQIIDVYGGDNAAPEPYDRFANIGIYDNDNTSIKFLDFEEIIINENGGMADACVSIKNPSLTEATTVDVNIAPWTDAVLDTDFSTSGGANVFALTFPAGDGSDQCFTITGIDDSDLEGTEYGYIYLSNIQGGDVPQIYEPSDKSVRINDDDGPQIEISSATPISFVESGFIDLCFSISAPDPINYNYAEFEVSGTAENGIDYQWLPQPYTIVFPDNSSSDQCITIYGIDDSEYEGIETLEVEITNVYNGFASIGPNSTFVIEVIDNEPISCWDVNSNGLQDPDEDINEDGFWNAYDCQGMDGEDGLHCWDLNGDGIEDANEDINEDGFWNAYDCQGVDGEDGLDGEDGIDGMNGIDGEDGEDGLHCWDTNGDGVEDFDEDVNNDGVWNALDCQGDPATQDGNGIYSGDGVVPNNTTVTISNILNFDGDIAISGEIRGLSDEKLKINKKPLLNGMALISQLLPKTYNFDVDKYKDLKLSKEQQYGLLAQEVERILPELVAETRFKNNESYKSINYNGLISILVSAVKEQESTLIEHSSKQVELEKEVIEMKMRLEKLEKLLIKE